MWSSCTPGNWFNRLKPLLWCLPPCAVRTQCDVWCCCSGIETGSRTAAAHNCKCVFMSRSGSPQPCYDHPGLQTEPDTSFLLVSEVAIPCMLPVMVPYPVAPLVPGLSPPEVGAFLHSRAASPTAPLSEEIQAFVGWALELLVLPPASIPRSSATNCGSGSTGCNGPLLDVG